MTEDIENKLEKFKTYFGTILSITTPILTILGGMILCIYGIMNDCLPYIEKNLSAVNFIIIGTLSSVFFTLLLVYGSLSTLFLVMILFHKLHKKKGHYLFMEEKISLKIIWFLVSFLLFFIFISLMKISYSKTKDPSLIYFLSYFMASGFISMAIIGKENTKIDILQRSGLSLIISVILLVPLHQATAPIMNVIMSIMGYRSNAEEAIFVDDDAAHKLTNVLSLYNKKLSACSIMIGPQRMWHLENGVITLQGIGEKIYIHIPNLPSQSFQEKQVLTLPYKGLHDCQFPQRITTNAPHKVPIDTTHQTSFHEPHIGFPDDPPPKKN